MADDARVKPPDVPLVAVIWDDAHVRATEESTMQEIASEHPYQFMTLGLFVRADEEIVAVASDYGEDGRFRTVNYIPRAMVRSILTVAPSAAALVRSAERKQRRQRAKKGTEPA